MAWGIKFNISTQVASCSRRAGRTHTEPESVQANILRITTTMHAHTVTLERVARYDANQNAGHDAWQS